METAWNITVMDIENTLKNACNKLLNDKSVDKSTLK